MMNTKEQIFKQLEFLAHIIPTPIYWLDLNGALLGANEANRIAVGADSLETNIGKTPYEYYPYELADNLMKHVYKVIETGNTLTHEDVIKDLTTGEIKYFTAVRSPIRDSDGTIIGVVGASIEITAQKEAEQLKSENLAIKLEEHEKFRKIADQMAHDLGSPLMALSVLGNSCAELPEIKRNMLKESIHRVRDIAGSLLNQYKPIQEYVDTDSTIKDLLVYPILEQSIMDKQYEYQNKPINFKCEYTTNSIFSFIKIDSALFKRMLSNLINNAVEATKSGEIILKLDCSDFEVQIIIIDSGCGMPQEVIDKIISNKPVTFGKANGHGIGFNQIHETLKQSNGQLSITSTLNVGTTITLTFPKIKTPDWIIKEIVINPADTIVILDDDNSIHGAWGIRFEEFIKTNPDIKISHFKHANDVLNFIRDSLSEKDNILLLTDYELLKRNIDGLQVIEQTHLKRSVLVTSHYSDTNIQKRATTLGTKILPKVLASEIPISLNSLTK